MKLASGRSLCARTRQGGFLPATNSPRERYCVQITISMVKVPQPCHQDQNCLQDQRKKLSLRESNKTSLLSSNRSPIRLLNKRKRSFSPLASFSSKRKMSLLRKGTVMKARKMRIMKLQKIPRSRTKWKCHLSWSLRALQKPITLTKQSSKIVHLLNLAISWLALTRPKTNLTTTQLMKSKSREQSEPRVALNLSKFSWLNSRRNRRSLLDSIKSRHQLKAESLSLMICRKQWLIWAL